MTPSPSHLTALPPCCCEVRWTRCARRVEWSAAAVSPRSSVSRVKPVRSRKQTAGGRSSGAPQTSAVERLLDIADDDVQPGVLLLSVEHRDEGLLHKWRLNGSPFGGHVEDDAHSQAGRDHGLLDLSSPPVRLGFGHPAGTLAKDA